MKTIEVKYTSVSQKTTVIQQLHLVSVQIIVIKMGSACFSLVQKLLFLCLWQVFNIVIN